MSPIALRRLVTLVATLAAPAALGAEAAAQACETSLVSVGSGGALIGSQSSCGAVSDEGRYVLFSVQENQFPFLEQRVWVRDVWMDVTVQVDLTSSGVPADAPSQAGDLSADGRFAVFHSKALNLFPGKTLPFEDIFLRDLALGLTTPISADSAGVPGNAHSFAPVISADGRFIAFYSDASNLVPGDTNGAPDVFVYDRTSGSMALASVSSLGAQGNSASWDCVLSADGRFVAFSSHASNFAPNDTNGDFDVFVHDRTTGRTTLISESLSGGTSPGPSWISSISGDGRFVAFTSMSKDLVPGDTNGVWDAFLHDRALGTTVRVSVDAKGNQLGRESFAGALSGDGSILLITSLSDSLAPGDANGTYDAFRIVVATGAAELISVDSNGIQGVPGSFSYSRGLSADGLFATFESEHGFAPPGPPQSMYLRVCRRWQFH